MNSSYDPSKGNKAFRHEAVSVKQAVSELLSHYDLDGKFLERNIANSWKNVLGIGIAQKTIEFFFRNQVLYVKIDSAPIKSELSGVKSLILERLKEDSGCNKINDLIFL